MKPNDRLGKQVSTWLAVLMSAAIALMALPADAAPQVLSATLNPSEITIGHTALLTITTLGSSTDDVLLPFVGGLEFRTMSQSRRVDAATGATRTTLVVRVTPQMAATFSIPPLAANLGPLTLTVNPDRLVVDASPLPRKAAPPRVVPRAMDERGIQLMADGAAFVRVGIPTRQAYVGENIPIEIEVGGRAGAVTSVNGMTTLTGGDFTLDNLSRQPERSIRSIDGRQFTVLIWHSVIAPVKQGVFPFSVEVPLTVKFSTRPKAEARFDELMGDPFLQNFFAPSVTRELKISSPRSELTVLALPTQNRPADFSGAVGTFAVSSELSAVEAAAGDPLSLRLHVTGTGNFDRVDTAMLASLPGWKTYPPRSSFKESDALGDKGEKVFEQTIIASRPGVQTLPALAFSFFDPATGRYETVRSAPLTVTIAKSLADTSLTAPAAGVAAGGAAGAASGAASGEQRAAGMRPDQALTARSTDSLRPPYLRTPFLAAYSLLTAGFSAAYLFMRGRVPHARRFDPRTDRQTARAIARTRAQLQAAAAQSPQAFFASARRSLQTTLAARWRLTPEEITVQAIDARLSAAGRELRELFELADEVRYSGRAPSAADYSRWTQVVVSQLRTEGTA